MGVFDNVWVEMHCPACEATSRKTLSWLKRNDVVVCPNGHVYSLETEDFKKHLHGAEQGFEEVSRRFRDLKRRRDED